MINIFRRDNDDIVALDWLQIKNVLLVSVFNHDLNKREILIYRDKDITDLANSFFTDIEKRYDESFDGFKEVKKFIDLEVGGGITCECCENIVHIDINLLMDKNHWNQLNKTDNILCHSCIANSDVFLAELKNI